MTPKSKRNKACGNAGSDRSGVDAVRKIHEQLPKGVDTGSLHGQVEDTVLNTAGNISLPGSL